MLANDFIPLKLLVDRVKSGTDVDVVDDDDDGEFLHFGKSRRNYKDDQVIESSRDVIDPKPRNDNADVFAIDDDGFRKETTSLLLSLEPLFRGKSSICVFFVSRLPPLLCCVVVRIAMREQPCRHAIQSPLFSYWVASWDWYPNTE